MPSPTLPKSAKVELSYRDVEDMLAERGIDVSYETVRRWALKFGTIIAQAATRTAAAGRAVASR